MNNDRYNRQYEPDPYDQPREEPYRPSQPIRDLYEPDPMDLPRDYGR